MNVERKRGGAKANKKKNGGCKGLVLSLLFYVETKFQ